MASLNIVHLIGNCGKDPELRYLPNGDAAVNLSIATSRSWKDKQTGDKVEETEWHRLSFFGRVAEIVGEYVKKGSPIYVEGRLKTRKWTDKDGVEKYVTEVICDQLQLLGNKPDGTRSAPHGSGTGAPTEPPQASAQQRVPASTDTGTGFDDMADDIPF